MASVCDLVEANTAKPGTKHIYRNSHQGEGLAVFTSGGDSQVK